MYSASEEMLSFSDNSQLDDEMPALKWNVLIADDDPAIHAVTKLVLADVIFEGRSLNFLSTYSGAETQSFLAQGEELAIVLLDVVMETPHSGLEVVRYLRETLQNHSTRVILRTGQPGEAPERAIITDYDINDYKEKADLTSQRLFSCVVTALRSYRDIITIEQGKRNLEKILDSSNMMFSVETSLAGFTNAVLDQMTSLLQSENSFMFVTHKNSGNGAHKLSRVLSDPHGLENYLHQAVGALDQNQIDTIVNGCLKEKKSRITETEYHGYFHSSDGFESVLYIRKSTQFSGADKQLLSLFSRNITLAFDNLANGRNLVETNREVVYALADLVESRNSESRGHNRRMSEYAHLVSKLLGMKEQESDTLVHALAFHDIGMITVPEQILQKLGSLNPGELVTVRGHPAIGAQLLAQFHKPLMQTASIIAAQHHERWDGTGYPARLAGEAIHPYARIATLVDTIDSLSRERPWRAALNIDQIRHYLISSSGSHLEPRLCDLVLERFDIFASVMNALKE